MIDDSNSHKASKITNIYIYKKKIWFRISRVFQNTNRVSKLKITSFCFQQYILYCKTVTRFHSHQVQVIFLIF